MNTKKLYKKFMELRKKFGSRSSIIYAEPGHGMEVINERLKNLATTTSSDRSGFSFDIDEYYKLIKKKEKIQSEMKTLNDLKAKVSPYKDTLVIGNFDSIVRLVDVIEDMGEYFWVYDSQKGIHHSSCVGGWIPLKGFIEQEEYDRMVYVWNLNNTDKAI